MCNRIINFFCFSLLILAAWSVSYSLAQADTCLTSTELIRKIEFEGWFVVFNGDKLHLIKEQPVNMMFTRTITQEWVKIGEGFCRIEGGHMS